MMVEPRTWSQAWRPPSRGVSGGEVGEGVRGEREGVGDFEGEVGVGRLVAGWMGFIMSRLGMGVGREEGWVCCCCCDSSSFVLKEVKEEEEERGSASIILVSFSILGGFVVFVGEVSG